MKHLVATWGCGARFVDCLSAKTLGWACWAPVKRFGSRRGPRCRAQAPGSSQHPSHLRNGGNEHTQGWRQESSWLLPSALLLGTSLEQGRMSHSAVDSDLSLSIWWQLPGLPSPYSAGFKTFAEPLRPRHEICCVLCIALYSISIGKLILSMKAQKN